MTLLDLSFIIYSALYTLMCFGNKLPQEPKGGKRA